MSQTYVPPKCPECGYAIDSREHLGGLNGVHEGKSPRMQREPDEMFETNFIEDDIVDNRDETATAKDAPPAAAQPDGGGQAPSPAVPAPHELLCVMAGCPRSRPGNGFAKPLQLGSHAKTHGKTIRKQPDGSYVFVEKHTK